jgi:hypothetical protein
MMAALESDNMPDKKRDLVQIKNPKSGHYVKIDRTAGMILDHKKSEGPYIGIPIVRKES